MQNNYSYSEEFSHINHFTYLNYILPWADKRSQEADVALHSLAVQILLTLMNKSKGYLIQQVDLEQVETGLAVVVNHRDVLIVPNESPDLPDPRAVTRIVKLAKKRHKTKRLILAFLYNHPFENKLNSLRTNLLQHLKIYRNTTPDHKQHQLVLEYYEYLKANLARSPKQARQLEA